MKFQSAYKISLMIASLTRLRLRSPLFVPGFFWYAHGSRQAMRRAPGFLNGRLLADKHLTFWTFTFWADEASMKAWRNAGEHGESMQKLKHWCDEASVARWDLPEGSPMPDWAACHQKMITQGRLTPVLNPSQIQQAGLAAIPAPTTRPSFVPIHPVQA